MEEEVLAQFVFDALQGSKLANNEFERVVLRVNFNCSVQGVITLRICVRKEMLFGASQEIHHGSRAYCKCAQRYRPVLIVPNVVLFVENAVRLKLGNIHT